MEDYRLEQTGQEVQRILNGAAMDANLQAEVERATDAEGTLQENIDAEAQARQDADGLLQQGIDDEAQRAKDAEEANAGEIEGIKALIPSTATSANKLADTNYVNSSIQTATAEYRGDYNVVTDLHLAIDATHAQIETLLPTVISTADKNDYCYVMIPTSAQTPTEISKIERYKMTSEGWKFEYDVNNSTFTAEEWAAIKSGITSGLVAKLNALPTNADLLLLLAGKQDVLTFDSVPVPESNNPVKSGGVYSAIDDEKTARLNSDTAIHAELDGLQAKVPATASSDNKLVDQNQMNSSISTATATYRGDWNVVSDLHLAVDATRAQIAALLPTVISTADNNDYCYVEIPTSAETPAQIERVERYKFNGTAWAYEYTLNNSGFTAAQWAAINSMITSGLVAKLSALPTNADLLAMLAQKQDNLTFDSTPTENSTNPVTSGGVFAADKALSDAIEAILLLIPSAASALNKLVDTSLMNSSISTATATFRGTYNLVSDLGLGIDATEGQIAAALSTAISTADNNDYAFVQIPTSAETPTQIARTDRYKFNGTAWAFEYTLNTSGFTAAQWAAINSGVTDTLVAELANIANLIPSEASQYNKLADKAYVITQIIAHIADFKGEYGTLLELQSVLNPKPGDIGIVRTKDNDGKDVYTFYQYKDSLWNEYYTLSYHPQIKPATTGTTGDYPYNGMGRVELPINMVNSVNTLTQDMFYKGAQGFREPNTNTVFVIRYDFTLGENISVPANCVLEFDGGSISGDGTNKNTITGNSTIIVANSHCLNNVILAGTFTNSFIDIEWFGIKSGSSHASYNDSIIQNYIIPSMENIKGVLYMSPKIDMTFTVPIVFNGDYDLELKGTLNYAGSDISTAITIGKASEATTNRNYYIYQLVGKTEFILNHTAEPVENVGVCLLNIKLCRITIGTISHFCYCLRLHGSSNGCASNEINAVAINGFYYYGIHILSTDSGWANENKFYSYRITPFSTNPVDATAIWFDSENSNSCNGNTFISPNIEGNTNGCKCTYAEYNLLLAARVESVTNILVINDNENGVSTYNTICANVVWNQSAIKDYGTNHVTSFTRLSDDKDLLWKDNLSITSTSSTYYGMALSVRTSSLPDPDNPDERIDMKECKLITSTSVSSNAIGRIVKFIDGRDGIDVATMSIRLSNAGRICIIPLNSTASGVLTEQVEDPDNPGHTLTVPINLPDFIESIPSIYGAPVNDYYKRKQENGFFITSNSTTYINLKIKKKGLYFIGVRPSSNYGLPIWASFYSDTLEVCNVFEVTNSSRIVINGMDDLDAWNINLARNTFLNGIKIIDLNKGLDLNGRTLDFSNKRINNNIHLGIDMLRDGTINVAGALILPDYNTLVDALSSDCNLSGMPAAGTLYWQNGKPTWSDGTAWVDATGNRVQRVVS